MTGGTRKPYSVVDGARQALESLIASTGDLVPNEVRDYAQAVSFKSTRPTEAALNFPCPMREQEATAAVKGLEACLVAAIADLRYGHGEKPRLVEVDMDRIGCFLMSAYITTIDGYGKGDPRASAKIPDTDLNQAQSNLYRRLSANLYATQDPDRYYHIHGSLDATTTLNMLGLAPFRPDLTEYRQCIDTIEETVKKFPVAKLEALNTQHRQAGIEALKWDDFQRSPHGQAILSLPPFTITRLEDSTPPVPFPPPTPGSANRQVLQGIKVLELCRVIAGPIIGRSLAAHGALVLKVTSAHLPDVPFFQLDVNTGKHTTSLDLKTPRDREIFEALLADADVVIDGYRPGALEKLGYGLDHLAAIARDRKKGFVYVAEDCFGGTGADAPPASSSDTKAPTFEWSARPGWQQIADCVTGIAWAQGRFMGLQEPVVPPFPMSDYGTGAMGAAAALAALHNRSVRGGSWACRTSLVQYDVFLLQVGLYPDDVQEQIRLAHGWKERQGPAAGTGFFDLRHADSVDEVGKRALKSMRRVSPSLFGDGTMNEAWSGGFGGLVRWPKETVSVGGVRIGHVRGGRPNGSDKPTWDGWEEEEGFAKSE